MIEDVDHMNDIQLHYAQIESGIIYSRDLARVGLALLVRAIRPEAEYLMASRIPPSQMPSRCNSRHCTKLLSTM